MPPKRREPAQTLSAHIDSSEEGEKIEVILKKPPAKRGVKKAAAATVVEKKPATRGRKKASVSRAEEPTEDEEVVAEEQKDDLDADELDAAPDKSEGRKKVPPAKATMARGKRGVRKVVEPEVADRVGEDGDVEEEPEPVKRGGRKAAIPVAAPAPAPEKKKRMTKKEKDAAAAAAKKAEDEKEKEIAETQFTPMQVDNEDDAMEVEIAPTPTQVHSENAKKAGAAGKKAVTVAKGRGRGKGVKAVEPIAKGDQDEDDDLALLTKVPVPVALRREKGVANGAVAGGGDKESDAHKELEKAFRELETRYKKLEYVRETEVEQSFAKYKKNAETKAKEADKLIDSLQNDLNAQTVLSGESKVLRKKLTAKEAEVAKLQSKMQDLTRSLHGQQDEAKVLAAKLVAAESKRGPVGVLGSAVKPGHGHKGGMMGGAGFGASDDAWAAKVKEELFQDLTGLLVMNVKKEAQKTVFECLQTSSTGVAIHFKLQVPDSIGSSSTSTKHQKKPPSAAVTATDSKDSADEDDSGDEIVYVPLLDEQRDRAVIAVLPDYLKLEIGFKKEQMTDFFAKITAFMVGMRTKRVGGDDDESEEEDDDEDEGDEEESEESEDDQELGGAL